MGCESLSETHPSPCPMTYGASGQPINTEKQCVYSPACAASGGLNCFEQTRCKYSDGFGKDLSASFPSNPCESLSETYPSTCPMTYGASGHPINTEKRCEYSDAISNPFESLSETYPSTCPMTYGASGQPINTDKQCVYSPACAASGGLNCFEQTGCKYS